MDQSAASTRAQRRRKASMFGTASGWLDRCKGFQEPGANGGDPNGGDFMRI